MFIATSLKVFLAAEVSVLSLKLSDAVKVYSFFCAFDKGQLSLDLPHRTIKTNDKRITFGIRKGGVVQC